VFRPSTEPFEARDELAVEDGDLAIEYARGHIQLRDSLHQVGEAPRVIETVPAGEGDLAPGLRGHHALPVVLLFVDPALAMKGLGQLGGMHQRGGCASRTRLTGHMVSVPLRGTGCLRARPAPPEGDEPPSRGCPFGLLPRPLRRDQPNRCRLTGRPTHGCYSLAWSGRTLPYGTEERLPDRLLLCLVNASQSAFVFHYT
jgi:hypothetical protein